MSYYTIRDGKLVGAIQPSASFERLLHGPQFLPPAISELHRSFRAWGDLGFAPGPIIAERLWVSREGGLAVACQTAPIRLNQTGLAPDLAAWLVLLDKWMETFVVLARARDIWSTQELGAALPFMTPAFLPPPLVAQEPANWRGVAQALAKVIIDGPLRGAYQDRHWRTESL